MLSATFEDALTFAVRRHAGQLRKGTNIPYATHLLAVCSVVLEHGGDEEEAIAALLHDAVEDQKATLDEIRDRFGARVAEIVAGCSDTDVVPKPPWRERKEAYIAHLASASPSTRLVSAADKLHNARSILFDYRLHGEALWDRFSASRDETLWYYRSVVDALRAAGSTPLVDELDRVVTEMEEIIGG
jgi:(p)ppGpp synthase/HD superfamily hydrolase